MGLVDGSIDLTCPDLVGASIVSRDFVGAPDHSPDSIGHGTSMAKLLVGQGHQYLRGVAPGAMLFAARSVGPGDLATPASVAAAIDWLLSENIRTIALPLGSETAAPIVDAAIVRGIAADTRFFAASGCGPGAILYPARHPSVIAVGPADNEGRPLHDARLEPRLDLLAPGWQIAGVTADGRACNGSSIACVLAAGVAALGANASYCPDRDKITVGSAYTSRSRGPRNSPWENRPSLDRLP